MADKLTAARRSENMRRVKGRNTKPELIVRRIVHGMGFRYRLHGKHLPGKPDLLFTSRRAVIFVHGCYWHQHPGCSRATIPQSNVAFWTDKLARNRKRDADQVRALKTAGWRPLVIWECETKDARRLGQRVRRFLDSRK